MSVFCITDWKWKEMTVVFQIQQAIARKEEASPPLQRFPVVCATIISATVIICVC